MASIVAEVDAKNRLREPERRTSDPSMTDDALRGQLMAARLLTERLDLINAGLADELARRGLEVA